MPGSLSHLSRRFLDVLTTRPLDPEEQAEVSSALPASLDDLFRAQPPADQRHGYETAMRVLSAGIDDPDVTVAALLHDVGKRHSGLGLIGRSLASVIIRLGVRPTRRFKDYRDHGSIGADELSRHGAPLIAVDFAEHHHADRPESMPQELWSVLVAADHDTKPGSKSEPRISS